MPTHTQPQGDHTARPCIDFRTNGDNLEAINLRRSTRLERIHKLGSIIALILGAISA